MNKQKLILFEGPFKKLSCSEHEENMPQIHVLMATLAPLSLAATGTLATFFTEEGIRLNQLIVHDAFPSLGSLALCKHHCESLPECNAFRYVYEKAACATGTVDVTLSGGTPMWVWLNPGT